MTWIQTVSQEEASGELKALCDTYIETLGFVPNVVLSTAIRPGFTLAFEALRKATTFGGSGLGRRKEELIALVVSAKNSCHY